MSDRNWRVELEQLDYQGAIDNGKKTVGRNHLLLIANGYVGVRGCFAELFDDKEDSSIHCIGIYDQVAYDDPTKDFWKEIINFPDFMSAPMVFDGERVFINRDKGNVEDFSISLDMRTAILTLKYIWKSQKGNRLKVEVNRFCAYHAHNLAYNTISLTSLDSDATLEYTSGINGDVYDANGVHLTDFYTTLCDGGHMLTAKTQQHKYQIAICSRDSLSEEAEISASEGERGISQVYKMKLAKNRQAEIISQHAVYTSRDSLDPVADAMGAEFDYERERGNHIQAMAKHWDAADVGIEVDEAYIDTHLRREIGAEASQRVEREIRYGLVKPENKEKRLLEEIDAETSRVKKSQEFMRYNLYILLISIPKAFDYASIPSRSLSYSTYKGAIFWEVDTYAFPFYAFIFPEYAKNLLQYRYKTLEYAIKKASDLGLEGAYFAWESLDTGEEATKKFVWKDIHSGRMMRNYFGDRQWHIAGDVIYALWQYYGITGDWEFMQNYGSHMTLLTARFVGSLVYYKATKDRYEILHTTCPDEYHEEVANNTFTNRILRFALEKALALIGMMEVRCAGKLGELLLQYGITSKELEYWQDIVSKIYIKQPDQQNRVIEQHDGYFELEDISLEEFKSRIIRDEYLGYPVGPAVHTQIIKQADVVQMLVMFKKEFHPIVRKATFDYYDLRTEHGSGDSPNAYGIVAAQVGRIDRALWYFLRSARIDLESANPARKANFQLGGVYIAPSGGTWQVIHYGFSGFEQDGDAICFNPALPKGWTKFTYSFRIDGQSLTVTVDRKAITIKSNPANTLCLKIKINDQPAENLEPGSETTKPYKKMGNHYYTYNEFGIRNQESGS